ncbi:shikimate kinase [Bacillus shivajii]|uniref:shikimate kinase n=1 Tax=Bacillus shivajii TaxID=1983719 RepID=UPI001CFA7944|nr:shikimate kinase [Bacillus shivajii]UCZ54577.1 shikimate kinase [Bacillus shivajii]
MKYNIYLIGFMGAGKTTIGKHLAKDLQMPFVDLDEWIEAKNNKRITDIFHEDGESTFRKLESASLHALDNLGGVIATGGGVVENDANIEFMKNNGTLIYLKSPFNELLERISGDETRPLTKGGQHKLLKRYEKREPMYEKADLHVYTFESTPTDVCRKIMKMLRV